MPNITHVVGYDAQSDINVLESYIGRVKLCMTCMHAETVIEEGYNSASLQLGEASASRKLFTSSRTVSIDLTTIVGVRAVNLKRVHDSSFSLEILTTVWKCKVCMQWNEGI